MSLQETKTILVARPSFKEYQFSGDKMKYLAPSWEEMGNLCFSLAQKIIESNDRFDRLVTLAKGGWTWSRTLADYLSLEKVASIRIQSYTDVGVNREPIIYQSLPVSIVGEEVLLFDDVVDSGKTIQVAVRYLEMCGATKIKTATLFYKPKSLIRPVFFAAQTSAWIIFPHEIREAIGQIGKKWLKQGVALKKIKERFLKIGLPADQIDYFLKRELRKS